MVLVPTGSKKKVSNKEHAGHSRQDAHDKHEGHSLSMFVQKFWISLILTVPVLATSELAHRLFGRSLIVLRGSEYLPLILGSVVFFYGGWVFLVGAWRELRGRSPGMMTLIGLATSVAYVFSVVVTLTGRGEPLFWELTTLITVMLLGHWLEMRAVQGAQGALRELSRLLPDTAEVLRGGSPVPVPLNDVRVDDHVLVRPGAKIPTDGVVEDGRSSVNEALVTGESKPVEKQNNSPVIAGTVNGDGVLTVRVTEIGERTFLAGVQRLVADAQASKSRLQLLADRAASILTVVALLAGATTFVAWLVARAGVGVAMERTVAVLVIACPHALGLAVPLVASISTTLAARSGLLVRQRLALEAARTIDTVVFDKTGTLTTGAFGVERVWGVGGTTEEEVLQLAASIDAHSEHVIAKAILQVAKERNIPLLPASELSAIPGQGMRGVINGTRVTVGGFSGDRSRISQITDAIREAEQRGRSIISVERNGTILGILALGDVIREESREAVYALIAQGIRVVMLTGDSADVTTWVARELRIDEFVARVQPGEKAAKVKELQQQGRRVAFVGDGINDAPALSQADVGIAIGTGTNVAIESAGILLVRNDPRDVSKIIHLSRATYRKMIQNIFWATGYNLIALPLAAGVLASRGIVLAPAASALFMSLSTVIVAINAVLLRRQKLT